VTIKVIKPGMLSTFQDTGRHGFQHWGVPVTGVMDEDAHALCNLLVGNPRTFSTLEMTLQGPTLHFQAKAVIALAGADLGAELDAIPLKPGVAALVSPGSTLSFGKRRQGARSYLAVGGGFLLHPLMHQHVLPGRVRRAARPCAASRGFDPHLFIVCQPASPKPSLQLWAV
jgi:allophanate hydrolase subunit 2